MALLTLLLRPPPRWLIRSRFGTPRPPSRSLNPHLIRWRPAALVISLAVVVLSFGGALPHLIAGCTAVGIAAVWFRLRLGARNLGRRKQVGREVAEAVDALAAELGSGVLANHAIQHLAEDSPLLANAATASRLGGDVASALRMSARLPGAEGLDDLAAAWEVSERSGAPMSRVLDRLSEGFRDERDVQREIDAGLGPAKATARLMAVLPLFGLGLGMNLGSSPIHVLLDTIAGSLCLAAGAALACAGVCWVDEIAARAAKA
ncbi:MAG: type II secretion system F family protein [Aeromicrobium sp.]